MINYNKRGGNGYIIKACYDEGEGFIKDALHVEMDTKNWLYDDDESAARAALRDGVKLVCGIPYVTDNLYIDTPENRKILDSYSQKMEAAVKRRMASIAVRKAD